MIDANFRALAFFEAWRCLRLIDRQTIEQPQFWANLLGAIANASIAAIPDSVAGDIINMELDTAERHRAARQRIETALDKAKGQ